MAKFDLFSFGSLILRYLTKKGRDEGIDTPIAKYSLRSHSAENRFSILKKKKTTDVGFNGAHETAKD